MTDVVVTDAHSTVIVGTKQQTAVITLDQATKTIITGMMGPPGSTTFTIAGDSGSSLFNNNNILTFVGGVGLDSNVSSTTVTFNIDSTVATLSDTQTLTNKTINLSNNTLLATSAQLAAAITDETGTGSLVFSTSPILTTPNIGAATATSITGTSGNLNITAAPGNNSIALSPTGTGTVDVTSKRITDVAEPIQSKDAATKNYVDTNSQPLTTITKTLTLTTDWQDIGINSTDLETGTYIIQLFANDGNSGGTNFNEYYSGIMSWYSGSTNSSLELPTDEIILHRAGGSGDGALYLRTFRSPSGDSSALKLQMYSNSPNPSSSNYVFKFRRMI